MAVDEARYRRLKDAGFSHAAALALADPSENEFGFELEPEAILAAIEPSLTATYATSARVDPLWGINAHAAHKHVARSRKGGVVGTEGKGVVCFRVDHGVDDFLASIWPLFKERGLPCTLGVVTSCIGDPDNAYEPTTTTWAQLRDAARQGFEVWSHSHTHQNPPDMGTTLHQEIVESKELIESNGLVVNGFTMPGIPASTVEGYGKAPRTLDSEAAQLIFANYGIINGYLDKSETQVRALPQDGMYGGGQYELDDRTLAFIQGEIDVVARMGLGIQLMLHPRFLMAGETTFSLANLTDLLDYCATLRAEGQIEVLTQSAYAFADPGTTRRLDLIEDPDFEAFAEGAATWSTALSTHTFGTDEGRGYVQIPSGASGEVYQSPTVGLVQNLGLLGQTQIVECEARPATATATAVKVTARRSGASSEDVTRSVSLPGGSGWTKVYLPVTFNSNLANPMSFRFGRASGGAVQIRGVKVRPA